MADPILKPEEKKVKTPTLPTRNIGGRTVIFDPRRRGGSALLPSDTRAFQEEKKAIQAESLDEGMAIINANAKKAQKPVVPVVPTVATPTPAPVAEPTPAPITPEQAIADISSKANAEIERIKAEATGGGLKQREIAIIRAQASGEIADIKAEQKIEADERAKLGKEFNQELVAEKTEGARGLQETMAAKGIDMSLQAASNQWTAMQAFNSASSFAAQAEILDEKFASPTFESGNAYQVAASGFGGNTTETEKYMKSRGFLDSDIDKQKKEWQKAKGWDDATIQTDSFKTTVLDLFSGEDNNVLSLSQFVKDSTAAGLSDDFITGQLQAISSSISADRDVRDEAAALVGEIGEKELTNVSVQKDRFGNFVRVNKATGEIEPLGATVSDGEAQPTDTGIVATTDPVVAAKARQILSGEDTLDNAKKTTSPQRFEAIGTELTRLRQEASADSGLTPNEKEAQGFLSAFNSGELTQKEILATIGVGNPDTKARFNSLVAEQGGKRVFGQDSATISDINTQIASLKALKDGDLYKNISGKIQTNIFSPGLRGDALTLIASVLSSQTLNALASAKGRGITFGALSTSEVNLVKDSAGKLAARAVKDNESGVITGFRGSETAFLADLESLIEKLEKSVIEKSPKTDSIGNITEQVEGGNVTIHNKLEGEDFTNHGSFQMNRDVASGFAKSLGMKNTDPESEEFKTEWDSKVQELGEDGFKQKENDHITTTMFEPQVQKLRALNIPESILNNELMKQAIFDTVVQHGTNTQRIQQGIRSAVEKFDKPTIQQIIEEIGIKRTLDTQAIAPNLRKGATSRVKKVTSKLTNNV